jgi:xanthine dehydrogenase YagS FAD-binding subunit
MGGVAHKPWRAWKLEASLRGAPANGESFRRVAAEELADAKPLRHNAFKVELAQRTIVAVLTQLAGDTL